jgi:Leucine-rich repeat (LRR) protein
VNKHSDKDGSIDINGPITLEKLKRLRNYEHIERLSSNQDSLLTAKIAQNFKFLRSVNQMWLWCNVTRAAVRHVVGINNLKFLDVLCIKGVGRLDKFADALTLERFLCAHAHYLTHEDISEISSCKSLKSICLNTCTLESKTIHNFLELPNLETLELEDSNFDDKMAKSISESRSIKDLEVGNTRLTKKGLIDICRMKQLEALDIWATNVKENDLDILIELPNLEYLSFGPSYEGDEFTPEILIEKLGAIKSLKRIWIDGVQFNKSEKSILEEKYEQVRITYE